MWSNVCCYSDRTLLTDTDITWLGFYFRRTDVAPAVMNQLALQYEKLIPSQINIFQTELCQEKTKKNRKNRGSLKQAVRPAWYLLSEDIFSFPMFQYLFVFPFQIFLALFATGNEVPQMFHIFFWYISGSLREWKRKNSIKEAFMPNRACQTRLFWFMLFK